MAQRVADWHKQAQEADPIMHRESELLQYLLKETKDDFSIVIV